jgi:hypothetical protein
VVEDLGHTEILLPRLKHVAAEPPLTCRTASHTTRPAMHVVEPYRTQPAGRSSVPSSPRSASSHRRRRRRRPNRRRPLVLVVVSGG